MERINVNKEEKEQMELSVQELRDYIKKKNGDFWLQIDFGKEGVQDGSRKDI